jgi:hypothetical protein
MSKTIIFILSFLFVTINYNSFSQETKLKRYELKSAIVSYETTITGGLLGSKVSGQGTEHLYFKNWGDVELKEEQSSQTTKTNIFGIKKTETTETHTMAKLDNGKSYSVDFKREIITLRRDPAMELTKTFAEGDVNKTGKNMLEAMGGKIVGQESILGYTCDIWDGLGGKQWIYKGLPLKIEVSMMGITTTTVATKANFNINVSDKYFQLPDFPIEEMESYRNDEEYAADKAEMKKNAQKMKDMSYSEYKAMLIKDDPEAAEMSEEEMKQSYQIFKAMMKKMSK